MREAAARSPACPGRRPESRGTRPAAPCATSSRSRSAGCETWAAALRGSAEPRWVPALAPGRPKPDGSLVGDGLEPKRQRALLATVKRGCGWRQSPRFSDPRSACHHRPGLLHPFRGGSLGIRKPQGAGLGRTPSSWLSTPCSVKTESNLHAIPDCVQVRLDHSERETLPSASGPAEAIHGDGVQHVALR